MSIGVEADRLVSRVRAGHVTLAAVNTHVLSKHTPVVMSRHMKHVLGQVIRPICSKMLPICTKPVTCRRKHKLSFSYVQKEENMGKKHLFVTISYKVMLV